MLRQAGADPPETEKNGAGALDDQRPAPAESAFAERWLARLEGEAGERIVRQHIELPFTAAAGWMKKPSVKLQSYEADMLAPPVAALLQRYVPLLLRGSKDPEWTAFFLAFGLYLFRVAGEEWAEKIMAWVSGLFSAPGTRTMDSLASSPSSDNPEPEKPTGLSRIFEAATAPSSATQ